MSGRRRSLPPLSRPPLSCSTAAQLETWPRGLIVVSVLFRRGQVSVRELQRAAGEGRRPSPLPQPGGLQEEEGADLKRPLPPPAWHPEPTFGMCDWWRECVRASVEVRV